MSTIQTPTTDALNRELYRRVGIPEGNPLSPLDRHNPVAAATGIGLQVWKDYSTRKDQKRRRRPSALRTLANRR